MFLIIENLYHNSSWLTHSVVESSLCTLSYKASPSCPKPQLTKIQPFNTWCVSFILSPYLLCITIYTIKDISLQYHGPYTMDSPNTIYMVKNHSSYTTLHSFNKKEGLQPAPKPIYHLVYLLCSPLRALLHSLFCTPLHKMWSLHQILGQVGLHPTSGDINKVWVDVELFH